MMSKMGFQILLGLFSLSLFHQTTAASFDEPCGHSTYCDVNVGLVCDNNFCRCSGGPLDATNAYDLQWDPSQKLCVGNHKSACVGTRQNSVPAGLKSVPCLGDLTCIQLRDMPLGVGSCENVPKVSLNGTACNEKSFCDSSRSLICTNGLCSCATSNPQTSPEYKLVWDDEMSNCVATVSSPCIGTKESPLATGQKSIKCVLEADCVEVAGHPPGVGVCKSRTESTTEPSTQSTTAESTTETSAAELINPTILPLIMTCVIAIAGTFH